MRLNNYLLLLLKDNPIKIPSVRFWALTLLLVATGIELKMNNGHILTIKDCYIEMNDCASGDCYRNSCPILNWLKQKKEYFGW